MFFFLVWIYSLFSLCSFIHQWILNIPFFCVCVPYKIAIHFPARFHSYVHTDTHTQNQHIWNVYVYTNNNNNNNNIKLNLGIGFFFFFLNYLFLNFNSILWSNSYTFFCCILKLTKYIFILFITFNTIFLINFLSVVVVDDDDHDECSQNKLFFPLFTLNC